MIEQGYPDEMRAMISLLVEMLSILSKTVCEKKPMNIVQGMCLYLNSNLRSTTPNTARQISNYIESISTQHNITPSDIKDVVSLKVKTATVL